MTDGAANTNKSTTDGGLLSGLKEREPNVLFLRWGQSLWDPERSKLQRRMLRDGWTCTSSWKLAGQMWLKYERNPAAVQRDKDEPPWDLN